jgi:hypothetical protein
MSEPLTEQDYNCDRMPSRQLRGGAWTVVFSR